MLKILKPPHKLKHAGLIVRQYFTFIAKKIKISMHLLED
jgi:hypothetical protein